MINAITNQLQGILDKHLENSGIRFIDKRGKLSFRSGKEWESISISSRIGICFHHAGAWGKIEDMAKYHISSKGWPGLAYSLVIEQDGSVIIAWDLDRKTFSQGDKSHPGDENEQYIGVLVNGFFSSDDYGIVDGAGEPTVPQLKTILCLIEWAQLNGLGDIRGHYHFGKLACPGSTIKAIIQSVRTWNRKAIGAGFDTITSRQRALHLLGYYIGKVDGIWGPYSKLALAEFQKDVNIIVDGIWGPQSQAAILERLSKKEEKRNDTI